MAKSKLSGAGAIKSNKKTRPGVHSKNNTSKSKKSRNYKKAYRGQGK